MSSLSSVRGLGVRCPWALWACSLNHTWGSDWLFNCELILYLSLMTNSLISSSSPAVLFFLCFLDSTEGCSNIETELTDCSQSAPSAQSCIQAGFRWSSLLWLAQVESTGEGRGMWKLRLSFDVITEQLDWSKRDFAVGKTLKSHWGQKLSPLGSRNFPQLEAKSTL